MRTRLNALVRTAKGMPANSPIDIIILCMGRRVIDRYGAADTDNVRYISFVYAMHDVIYRITRYFCRLDGQSGQDTLRSSTPRAHTST